VLAQSRDDTRWLKVARRITITGWVDDGRRAYTIAAFLFLQRRIRT
jgi:hypothetical protein